MVKLFCAIIGEKRVITIDIDPQEAVGDLKKLITKEAQYEFPSHKLALFLAKKNSNKKGEWMKDDDDDLVRFQIATLPMDMERSHLKKELLLKPTWSIGDYFNINDKNFPKEKAIHVLVDIRGRDHASVANDKYSLLIGGRKTRGKKCGDVVEEQKLRGGSHSCHTSTIPSFWSCLLSFFFLDTVSGTKKNV